jgi:hypothetical protein
MIFGKNVVQPLDLTIRLRGDYPGLTEFQFEKDFHFFTNDGEEVKPHIVAAPTKFSQDTVGKANKTIDVRFILCRVSHNPVIGKSIQGGYQVSDLSLILLVRQPRGHRHGRLAVSVGSSAANSCARGLDGRSDLLAEQFVTLAVEVDILGVLQLRQVRRDEGFQPLFVIGWLGGPAVE